jgi:hypothetical protein
MRTKSRKPSVNRNTRRKYNAIALPNRNNGTKRKYFRRTSFPEPSVSPFETIIPKIPKMKKTPTPSPFETMVLQNSPIQNVVELDSNAIHYLVDFAGTDTVIDAIISNNDPNKDIGEETKLILGSDIHNINPIQNILHSKNAGTEATHWVYYDKKGVQHNSYLKKHQPLGSNGFCQSFAILYMLKHTSHSKEFRKMVKQLKPNDFENNNLIVIQFWKYILKEWFHYEDMMDWCIDIWKQINDEKIKDFSKTTRVSKIGPMKPLLDDSSKIDKTFILNLMDYLETNIKTITEKINKNIF